MSVLAAALTSMAEQISLMAQVQAAAIVENRDKADLQALLQKQNIELISRIAPVVAGAQDLTGGGRREETSQPRDLGLETPVAVPGAVSDASSDMTREATKVVEGAKASAETAAPAAIEPSVEPVAEKAKTPRVLPSLVSPMAQAPAVADKPKAPRKESKSAPAKARGEKSARGKTSTNAKSQNAPSAISQGAAEITAPAVTAGTAVSNGEAAGSGKRFRRTKAQMEEFRLEQERLAKLGLKRGRGRPSKTALTAEQLAAIAASEDPEAALAEAMAAIRAKPVATTPKNTESNEPEIADAQSEQPVVGDAPAAEAAPVKAKAGRKSKAAPVVEAAVAPAPEPVAAAEGKRRGPKPKVAVAVEIAAAPEPAPVPAAAPEGKRRGRKPKAVAVPEIEAAPVSSPQPVAAPEGKRRGRKPKAAATSEPAPAAESAPLSAPKRRGPKPKAASPQAVSEPAPAVVKRPRGRPRKDAAAIAPTDATKSSPVADSASSVNWAKVKFSSDVMVLNAGKTTTMQIGRKVWQAAGFADDEAVFVSSANGQDIKIVRQPGGRKPSAANGSVITLTVPSIGDASLWKIKYAVDGGALLLHGQIAN
jgi:hypothetical protein